MLKAKGDSDGELREGGVLTLRKRKVSLVGVCEFKGEVSLAEETMTWERL